MLNDTRSAVTSLIAATVHQVRPIMSTMGALEKPKSAIDSAHDCPAPGDPEYGPNVFSFVRDMESQARR